MTAGRSGPDGGKAYFAKVMAMCAGVMQGIVNCKLYSKWHAFRCV
jgi:hypothetical protein